MKVGIVGILGKVGRELVKQIIVRCDIILSGAAVASDSSWRDKCVVERFPCLNENNISDINLKFTDNIADVFDKSDVVIDFSSPEALNVCLDAAQNTRTTFISGTTGFGAEITAKIQEVSKHTKICWSSNMSIGVAFVSQMAEKCAAMFKDYDAEIIEIHHNKKKDSPSGTAKTLGECIARGRDVSLENVASYGRGQQNNKKRVANEIGFSSVRGGNIVGEHSACFFGNLETIKITHIAHDRGMFAKGALDLAILLHNQMARSGLFTICDLVSME